MRSVEMVEMSSETDSPGDFYKLKKTTTIIQPKRANTKLRRHESDGTISGNGLHVTKEITSWSPLQQKTWTGGSTLPLKKGVLKKDIPEYPRFASKEISQKIVSEMDSEMMNEKGLQHTDSQNMTLNPKIEPSLLKSQIEFIPFVKNGVKSFCFQLSCDPIFSDKLRVLPVTTLEYTNVRKLQSSCGALYDLNEVLTPSFIVKTMLSTFLEFCRYRYKCRVALHENIQKDLLEDYKLVESKSLDFAKHRPHVAAIDNLATYLMGTPSTNKLQEAESCRILPYPKKKKAYWDTKLWCYFFRKKKTRKRKSKSVVVYKLNNDHVIKNNENDSLFSDISVHYSSNFSSSDSSSLAHIENSTAHHRHTKADWDATLRETVYAQNTAPNFQDMSIYQTIQPSLFDKVHFDSDFDSEDSHPLQDVETMLSDIASLSQLVSISDETMIKIHFSKELKKKFRRIKTELNRLHCTTHSRLQFNTLFQCTSMNLFGTRDYHVFVRHHVVAHMSEMRNCYLPFFPSEKMFIKYLFEMSDENTCGDLLCLRAIADSFHCSLHVIMERKTIRHFSYNPVDNNNQSVKPLRHLLFCYVYPTYFFDFYFGIP